MGRKQIGRYELVCPLSMGGMAAVFLGRLSGIAGFQKLVAIKVIHPHLSVQRNFVEMFLDEARLSARIHHPNVVEIFEVGESEGLYFMVAELVRGRSLRDLMRAVSRSNRSLEPPIYLTIIARVCDALHSAHTLKGTDGSSLGIVHRDVSPGNIMISYDGIVKLIDFGIAFAKGRITETESGVVKGKLDYMAPEQLHRKASDRRADIFSTGVVLYQLATGRHPFWGDNEGARLEKQLECVPIPPQEIVSDMSSKLAQTITRALSRNPEDRQQTAEELGRELRNLSFPYGALVDQQVIADLMSEIFAAEIVADNGTLDRAMEMPQAGNTPFNRSSQRVYSTNQTPLPALFRHPPDTRFTEIIEPTFQSPKETLDTAEPPVEEVDSKTKPPWKTTRNRVAILAIVAAVAFLALILLKWPFESEKPGGRIERDPTSNEAPGASEKNFRPSGYQQLTGPDSQAKEPPAQNESKVTSVKIRLKGLPKQATVRLDGHEAMIVAGQLTVPVDDTERELKVTAEGYKPYLRKIKPTKDAEITVDLEKKRALPRKRSHTNNRKAKNEPKNKLQTCAFCD